MGIESFDNKFEAESVLDEISSKVTLLTHSEDLEEEERRTMQGMYHDLETIIANLRDRKAESSSMSGSINEKGEFVRGKDVDSENPKGFVNEKGEFVRGKSINETKPEEDNELPVHLL